MRLEIVAVAPDDHELFARWHATYLAANVHEVGRFHICWTLPEMQVAMEPNRLRAQTAYVGIAGGEVVVSGFLGLPLLDNLDSAVVVVSTVPSARRCGHGTAMLAVLEDAARGLGRLRLDSDATYPYDAGSDGAGVPAVAFAARHGFVFGISDVERELTMPVEVARLDALAAEAAPHHAAYTLRSWVGRVPRELEESRLVLANSLMTEAPTGEMELEVERMDLEAHHEAQDQLERQGRVAYRSVAVDDAGTVVAYTDLVTTVHEPGRAYQWGTLVRRADRGHRLGLAVKTANHRLLQRERADITRVTTFNAEVNAHMIDVNDRLGFVPVARLAEFQKRLAPTAG